MKCLFLSEYNILGPLLLAGLTITNPANAQTNAQPADTANQIVPAPTPLNPVQFLELPSLSDPVLSPDGRSVVFVKSRTDWKKNRKVEAYYLADLESGEVASAMEARNTDVSLSRVTWSPDSKQIAAALELKGDKFEQVYVQDVGTKELRKVTQHHAKVSDLHWSEDGRSIYFRARRNDPVKAEQKKFQIKPYDTELPYELWRYDTDNGKSFLILGGDVTVENYSVSRDGTKILVRLEPDGAEFEGKDGELWVHDISTATTQQLTNNGYREANPKLSPDNTRFAYIATVNERGEGYYEDNLFMQTVGATQPRLLLQDTPMEILEFEWDKSGNGIFIVGNIGLRNELFHLTLSESGATGDHLERLTTGDHSIGDWSYNAVTGQHLAIVDSAKSPGEVHIMSEAGASFEPITTEYANLTDQFSLPEQVAFTWRAKDGQALEGILAYPVGYNAKSRYPLITITHGGPRSSAQFGAWNRSRYVSVLTGLGYAVFLPNHRGGTGYGDVFMRDMVGQYFRNAHTDVLDGIDALIEKGIADPDKLIKLGWSAGGHMTNKLITVTDRFVAASSGAGVSDWVSLYGESDQRHNRTPWFGGSPWQKNAPVDSYADQSLLKDAWRVRTPTLFFNGGNDVRVPPTQQIMMYRGVRTAGVPTRLYIAEGEPHNFRKPLNELFKINTELAWFAHYALGTKYEPVFPAIIDDSEVQERVGNPEQIAHADVAAQEPSK